MNSVSKVNRTSKVNKREYKIWIEDYWLFDGNRGRERELKI